MAIFYDGKGNQILIIEPTKGNELIYQGLSPDWLASAEVAYNLLQAEREKVSYSGVPFFIQTDAHGRSNAPARWLHNKDKTIKNLNLGDIVLSSYNTPEASGYRESALSVENLITVLGNHEAFTTSAALATSYNLNYYYTDTTKGKRTVNNNSFFKVNDDDYNVKYLAICPYYMDAEGMRQGARIDTVQMNWLLEELAADDGYDIIVLQHQLFNDLHYHRDGTVQEWGDAPQVLIDFWEVLKDRRNKRSGAITDSDGVEHTYDFSNVKSRYLGSLHGHSHEELMYSEENTVAYVADWYGNAGACVFGLFDRVNNKLKVWQFNSNQVSDVLELDI